MFDHKLLPLVRHIFSTFVVAESFESVARLFLCPSLELLESVKGVALFTEEPAATIARGVVSE
jgi:hypothetical protein